MNKNEINKGEKKYISGVDLENPQLPKRLFKFCSPTKSDRFLR